MNLYTLTHYQIGNKHDDIGNKNYEKENNNHLINSFSWMEKGSFLFFSLKYLLYKNSSIF